MEMLKGGMRKSVRFAVAYGADAFAKAIYQNTS
jgi:hypothetical protein